VAATDCDRATVSAIRRFTRALFAFMPKLAGLMGGLLASGAAESAELPEDRAEMMVHAYDGGGVRATGPALLVRKSLINRVSLYASYYVDMVSNASIDVVTTASPYRERRREEGAGVDILVRDSLITLATARSREPDYTADAASVDVAQEVFGGMTTISLGYTRGIDTVGKNGTLGQFDVAGHWRYRIGVTQVMTPRWLVSLNAEALSDEGFLGSPYRAARVFGAAVPERNPRTRSARAIKLRAIGDIGWRSAVRVEYRYYYDTWDIHANTAELGLRRYFGDAWLADGYVRAYSQDRALFYSDNATSETTYVSRNRQLSTFHSIGLGAKLAYTAARVAGRYEIKLNGAYELVRYSFDDFTDIRSGQPYSHDANVLQLSVSATF
jgi:hypothetical protein